MNGDTLNGELTGCNTRNYLEALCKLRFDGPCMTPSLSTGSSVSFCTSVMNDDPYMAEASHSNDLQQMTDETSPGLDSVFENYCYNVDEQQYLQSLLPVQFYMPQFDIEPGLEYYQDTSSVQTISDEMSELEQSNTGNMQLDLPPQSCLPQSYPLQSTMSVQTRKKDKSRPGQSSAPKRVFKCTWEDCGTSFSRTADLMRHQKHVHLKERMNTVCDYPDCPRYTAPFSRKDHYREHLRDSHGEDITKRGVNVHLSLTSPRKGPSSAGSKKDGEDSKGKQASRNEPRDGSLASYPHGEVDRYALSHGQECSNSDLMRFDAISGTTDGKNNKDGKPNPEEERLRNCIVDPTWWRCSRCLHRVPRKEHSELWEGADPEEEWKCPSCNVNIEPIRRKIREEADRATALAVIKQSTSDDKRWC